MADILSEIKGANRGREDDGCEAQRGRHPRGWRRRGQDRRPERRHAQRDVDLGNGITGLALNLDETEVGVVILGDYTQLQEGGEAAPRASFCKYPWARGCWAAL